MTTTPPRRRVHGLLCFFVIIIFFFNFSFTFLIPLSRTSCAYGGNYQYNARDIILPASWAHIVLFFTMGEYSRTRALYARAVENQKTDTKMLLHNAIDLKHTNENDIEDDRTTFFHTVRAIFTGHAGPPTGVVRKFAYPPPPPVNGVRASYFYRRLYGRNTKYR